MCKRCALGILGEGRPFPKNRVASTPGGEQKRQRPILVSAKNMEANCHEQFKRNDLEGATALMRKGPAGFFRRCLEEKIDALMEGEIIDFAAQLAGDEAKPFLRNGYTIGPPSPHWGRSRSRSRGTAADAREVYTQPSRELAEERMAAFIAKWGKAYPSFRNYAGFKSLFEFYSLPRPLWKSTYTSNVIEGFNSKFKRETAQRNNLNSLENASAVLIAVVDSYNRSMKVKRIKGYYEMTEGELEKARMAR